MSSSKDHPSRGGLFMQHNGGEVPDACHTPMPVKNGMVETLEHRHATVKQKNGGFILLDDEKPS